MRHGPEVAKERPIIMTGESVRSILAGTKTQTRRIVTTRHPVNFIGSAGDEAHPSDWCYFFDGPDHNGYMVLGRGHDERHDHGRISIPCPYGEVGDRLWVREAWRLYESDKHNPWPDLPSRRGPDGLAFYREGFDRSPPGRWRSPLFMPRWASRLTLEVAEVRVQRLQDISDKDARAEGVAAGRIPADDYGPERIGFVFGSDDGRCTLYPTERKAFAVGWDAINGKRRRREHIPLGDPGYGMMRTVVDETASWDSNPWVWTVSFSVKR